MDCGVKSFAEFGRELFEQLLLLEEQLNKPQRDLIPSIPIRLSKYKRLRDRMKVNTLPTIWETKIFKQSKVVRKLKREKKTKSNWRQSFGESQHFY